MNFLRLYVLASLFCFSETIPAQESRPAPNVLVLMVDDLGWNGVGFHNPKSTTPNLDQMARESVELQRFYTCPVCSPTRAALLTGQMPRRLGIVDVVTPQQTGLPAGIATLPATFRAAGYQTSLIGKWHLGSTNPPMKQGFDHFFGFLGAEIDYFKHTNQRGATDWQRDGKTVQQEGYSTYLFADEAIRQIKEHDARHPFFMEVAFNAPHNPFQAPEDLVARHKDDGGVYPAMIEAMDKSIGRILAALDEQGLRDRTLVLFFSDNGASLRTSSNAPLSKGKDTVYEGGIRTPCLIRWPGHVPAGTVSQQPVAVHDLFPTLAAAAGVALPGNTKLDGVSQWTSLQAGKAMDREPFLITSYDTALIDGDWKLIEWSDGRRSLFNLRSDISESRDEFAGKPEVAERLSARLEVLKKDLPVVGGRPARKGPPGNRRELN